MSKGRDPQHAQRPYICCMFVNVTTIPYDMVRVGCLDIGPGYWQRATGCSMFITHVCSQMTIAAITNWHIEYASAALGNNNRCVERVQEISSPNNVAHY